MSGRLPGDRLPGSRLLGGVGERGRNLGRRVTRATGYAKVRALGERVDRLERGVAEEGPYLDALDRSLADLGRRLARVWPIP